jgi:hypothetical protein
MPAGYHRGPNGTPGRCGIGLAPSAALTQEVEAGAGVHQEVVVGDVPGVGAGQAEDDAVAGP